MEKEERVVENYLHGEPSWDTTENSTEQFADSP